MSNIDVASAEVAEKRAELVPETNPDPHRVRAMSERRPTRAKPVKRSRSEVNFWLDVILLVLYVLLAWVTAVLNFVFPPVADATGWTLWGGDVVFWRDLQFWLLCVMTVGITLHLMLHWPWVCGVLNRQIFRREVIPSNGTETLVGAGLIVVVLNILAAALLAAWWSVHRP